MMERTFDSGIWRILEQQLQRNAKQKRNLHPLLALYWLMSLAYHGVVKVRNFLYDRHWIECIRVHPLVVSIGNIAVGGTGKTPLAIALGQALCEKAKIGVLTRGYKSQTEKTRANVHFQRTIETSSDIDPSLHGDEASLLYQKIPKFHLFVGKSRAASAQWAEELGCDLLLLDDGMQHRKLHRDLEIVTLHGDQLFGGGYFLPRGLLRDEIARLATADYIVIGGKMSEETFREKERAVKEHTDAPVIGMEFSLHHFEDLSGNLHPISQGAKVSVISAIANKEQFTRQLETEKELQVLSKHFLPDHAPIRDRFVQTAWQEAFALGSSAIIVSEKDAVKMRNFRYQTLPIFVAVGRLLPTHREENYLAMIQDIENRISESRT